MKISDGIWQRDHFRSNLGTLAAQKVRNATDKDTLRLLLVHLRELRADLDTLEPRLGTKEEWVAVHHKLDDVEQAVLLLIEALP